MKKRLILSLVCVVMLAAVLALNIAADTPVTLYIGNGQVGSCPAMAALTGDQTVAEWYSKNTTIATVAPNADNNVYATITAVSVGECEVVVELNDGSKQTFVVTVEAPVCTELKIKTPPTKTSYHIGDAFDPTGLQLEVLYSFGPSTLVSDSREFTWLPKTFSADDTVVHVIYFSEDGGTVQADIPVTVSEVAAKSIAFLNGFKTEYKVDETVKVESAKVTYMDGTTATITTGFTQTPAATHKLTLDDKTVTITLDADPTIKATKAITVTGEDMLDPDYVRSFTMKKEGYPVGYTFALTDINYIEYGATAYKTSKLYQTNFSNYGNTFTLEVLDDDADRKSSKKTTVEAADVFTDRSTGKDSFYLLLTIDKEPLTLVVPVKADTSVVYSYHGSTVATYDTLKEALNYTITQDANVRDYFKLTDFIHDPDATRTNNLPLTLTLSADDTLVGSKNYSPEICDVEIDLNGHTLSLNLNSIVIARADKHNVVTITNTSKTDAKIKYYDQNGSSSTAKYTITVAKGDELVFEYDKNVAGLYTVTINTDKNGHVANGANSLTAVEEVTAVKGDNVVFRIIPNTGYAIDTVKYNGSDVTKTTAYEKKTSGGVDYALYTVKGIDADGTLDVTFFEEEVKEEKVNPFTDVSKNSKYYAAVLFGYYRDPYLIKGTETTKFSPTSTMTRAQFMTVLGRLAEVDIDDYAAVSEFTDCQPTGPRYAYFSYAVPYIAWANEVGLIEGYGDGTFGPENPVTHAQMYTIMARYEKYIRNKSLGISTTKITVDDKDEVADWAEEGVKFATKKNLLIVVDNKITPKANAKRSDLAMLLYNYCTKVLGETAD